VSQGLQARVISCACAVVFAFLVGPPAQGLAAAVPKTATERVAALEQVLSHDRFVQAAVGASFDIVRIQPVGSQSDEFVVDVATASRSSGLRALVNLATSGVVRTQRLDPVDIVFTQSDVAEAFALVRNLPSVRARLGSTLPLYRVDTSLGVRPHYAVEALPVRGAAPGDPCTTHRCLELLFHAPRGYVAGPRVLVDLTAGHRIEGPTGEAASRVFRASASAQVQVAPSALAGLASPECQTVRFFSATTSWNICWTYVSGYGLVLGPVSFKKPRGFRPLRVIEQASVAQIFVPYASGDPRFYDTSFGFPNAGIGANLCLKGALFDGGTACLEHRDRDVDWMFPDSAVPSGRRGEEAVLWSVLYAANYLYIEEWGFRDDGIFWGRVGATGQNLPGIETESHTHDYVWRIVPHIAARGNSVNYVGINEPVTQLTAPDVSLRITHPTSVVWNPQRFDQVEIYAPGVTNGRGDTTSYRLIPQPNGGLAHHQEAFTQADLWATKGDPLETDASSLPVYVKEKVSLVNADIALWYRGSFRHQPRDEDGYYDSSGSWIGTTHTLWTGFLFMPRNLFDSSPFF
jgi:primary-amine oxidase